MDSLQHIFGDPLGQIEDLLTEAKKLDKKYGNNDNISNREKIQSTDKPASQL
jgi:hypothetical protein